MAKTTGLFRIIAGVGAAAAVVLSRKESRDKLKEQYNKYKKIQKATKKTRGLASQLSSKANETIQEVRNNPQDYANRLKMIKIILEEKNQNLLI